MTDQQKPPEPADAPTPDPGNADPEQWTGEVYVDDDLAAQLAAATDGLNPLDDPNSTPPVAAGETPPGSDPDGARTGEHALAPGATVDPADVYVPDVDQPPARAAGGKFLGKQQPTQTVEGA
ncbi:hypothetical protein [Micromonospora sp. NPDC049645]|uniref:hypothetical protein n=1 Tax=Micromonospora sp. NPDC049645 TaxID=3155508 RepID=UPI003420F3B3